MTVEQKICFHCDLPVLSHEDARGTYPQKGPQYTGHTGLGTCVRRLRDELRAAKHSGKIAGTVAGNLFRELGAKITAPPNDVLAPGAQYVLVTDLDECHFDKYGQVLVASVDCVRTVPALAAAPQPCQHEWSAARYLHECLNDCGATMSARTGAVRIRASESDADGKQRTQPAASQATVQIGGDRLLMSNNEFERRASMLLADEQGKIAPDNALVDFICNAVRLSRENVRLATAPLAAPQAQAPQKVYPVSSRAEVCGHGVGNPEHCDECSPETKATAQGEQS